MICDVMSHSVVMMRRKERVATGVMMMMMMMSVDGLDIIACLGMDNDIDELSNARLMV